MQEENWQCFMCTGENVRLLRIRGDWQECMKEIFNEDQMQINFVSAFNLFSRNQSYSCRYSFKRLDQKSSLFLCAFEKIYLKISHTFVGF